MPRIDGLQSACQAFMRPLLEAVSKILAEQNEDAAEMHEAEVIGGMIFIADHQTPDVA